MTKKSLNKLLSVILTLAICSAAVFGCLITANAEDVTCYEWSEGVVAENLKSATINLTLTAPSSVLPDGMAEAELGFTADADLVLNSVEVTDGVPTSGAFNAADFEEVSQNENGKYLIDVKTADKYYTSVVLKLTFGFTGGTAASGAKYNVRVTANSLTMFDAHDNSFNYTGTGTVGVIKTGCDHIYDITGATLVTTNTVEGYRVYKDVACKNCGVVNPYQVVPATELKNVIYWDGATQTEPTAQDADGNYIISTAEELAYIAGQTDAAATSGKSYKIADGIGAIVLQKQADVDGEKLMGLADYAQTKAYFDALASKTVWVAGTNTVFAGTLDGNGAEIYGIYTDGTEDNAKDSVGLFGSVAQGVTIKNLAVKNSYVAGLARVGALFGGVTSTDNGTVTVEKVIISGCYVEGNATGISLYTAGVMAGSTLSSTKVGLTYRNCLVYSNHSVFSQDKRIVSSIVGMCNAGFNQTEETTYGCNNQFENSIILDCVPYTLLAGQNNPMHKDNFANIYTNAVDYDNTATWPAVISVANWFTWANFDGKIVSVHRDDVKGAAAKTNCANLAWDTVWFADPNGGYPTFDNAVVAQKSVIYVENEINDPVGAWANVAGEGTEADPYVISTIGQLRYLAQKSTYADTNGKYYTIDPSIGTIVFQREAYINNVFGSLDAFLKLDVNEIRTRFTNNTSNLTQYQSGNANSRDGFAGHFDFNGVKICGVYTPSGGLFSKVRGNATFKNLDISKSVIFTGGDVGALISNYYKTSDTEVGELTVENCAVYDCYLESTANYQIGIGAIFGRADNCFKDTSNVWRNGNINIKNCFVNIEKPNLKADSAAANSVIGGLGGIGGTNQCHFTDSVVLGIAPYSTEASTTDNSVQHTGYEDRFSNIYTDSEITGVDIGGNQTKNHSMNYTGKMTKITANDVKGAAAKTNCPNLDWSVWSYDGNGGYPSPVSKGKIDTISQYILNLKAANIAYNTDGTFNFNFYYEPTVAGVIPVLYVGQADGSGFDKLTGTALTAEEIAATPAYEGLAAGVLRYTIKNISAREIDDTMLPTAVAKIGATTYFGKTEQISVADYAKALISSEDASVTDGDKQVASALVNYGTAAATALATAAPGASDKTVVYLTASNKEPDDSFMNGTHGVGTETDPYIISTPGQLRYIVQRSTTASTKGKFYKIDPTIGTMVLQLESYIKAVAGSLDAFLKLDAEGTKTALSTTANRQQWQSSSGASDYDGFAGNIDFSGVTICGMYNANGGLFALARGATFKNLTLSNNYITSTWYNGNLIGMVRNTSGAAQETLTIDRVVVRNCYQSTTGNGYANTGVLIGTTMNSYNIIHRITNILTYGNVSLGQTSSSDTSMSNCALYGALSTTWNGDNSGVENAYFEDIVTLDCVPYPIQTVNNQTTKAKYWHGSIYTTHYDANHKPNSWAELSQITAIKQISASQLKGGAAVTAMPDLDWTNGWVIGNGNNYPMPVQNGVTLKGAGRTIYWSGNTDSTLADGGEAGTAKDPIIIDSAEELAYLVSSSKLDSSDTLNKYYKIADGIDKIVLQPSSNSAILGLTDAAAVKAYFSNTSGKTLKEWKNTSWNGTAFAGTFDGNGVEIYGMYEVTASREQALFPEVDAGAVLKNFTLKNSYVTTSSNNYCSAFITSRSIHASYGAKTTGIVKFEKIGIVNNYMSRAVDVTTRAGLLSADFNDIIAYSNCFAYGNDATYTFSSADYKVPFIAAMPQVSYTDDYAALGFTNINGNVGIKAENSIILGSPYARHNLGWQEAHHNTYKNVYIDIKHTNSNVSYGNNKLMLINAADLIGSGGKATVDALNTANGGATVWYTGNPFDGYPSLEESGSMPNAYQSAYDAVDFTSYNSYTGSNDQFGVYTTSLNLKNNPYLSIVFAFGKEGDVSYKENRANINVTVTGASGTIYSGNVPAYVEGEYISGVNGWTNKKNAGRFHTLKLDAPVYDLVGELTVTINYNSGEKVVTNKVSVSGFGNELLSSYKKNPSDYYANCAEAVKALLFYTQSVKQVYGSK